LFEHGWFWWIPFAGDLTSVGCVLHQKVMANRQAPIEQLFDDMIAAAPSVAAGLAGATRVTSVHSTANFSYRTSPVVGDSFVVVGAAVHFVAALFSTGVRVAMQSAELPAGIVAGAIRSGDFRAARFARYRRRVERGTELFFRLIDRYYEPAFMDVLLAPNPPPVLRDAVLTVLAGGAFLRRPLLLRLPPPPLPLNLLRRPPR